MVLYPMNEMLAHIESRYLLVNMVAHSGQEISEEAERNPFPWRRSPSPWRWRKGAAANSARKSPSYFNIWGTASGF